MRAFEAGVPAPWEVADSGYGRSHAFRAWLEEQSRAYVVMVPRTNAVHHNGQRQTAEKLVARLPEEDWMTVAGGPSTHVQTWACVPLTDTCWPGMRRWLLIRRHVDDPEELAYFLACGPAATTVEDLVRVCRIRWVIEECIAQAKGEVGLDHCEVRKWDAWHRFVTLCLLAHAVLVVVHANTAAAEEGENGGPIRLTSSSSRSPRCADSSSRCWNRAGAATSASVGRGGAGYTKP